MSAVAPRRTYPGTVKDWLETRHAALTRALERRGVPFDEAARIARTYVASSALETGWGRREFNFNLTNLHATPASVPDVGTGWGGDTALRQGSDGTSATFRAYDTLDDGALDQVDALSAGRYAPAWAWVLRHPDDAAGWYERLLRPPGGGDGWHPWHAGDAAELAAVLASIPRRVTVARSAW